MLTTLRAGAAAGLRSQPALLEEGRRRHRAAVSRSGRSSRSCPTRTPSWCACSRGRSTCCSSRCGPKTSPRCGRSWSRASCSCSSSASAPIPTCSSSTCGRRTGRRIRARDWITRKEFRQAISHAIDREAFANTVFLGAGVPIWGPVTPGNKKWFSPNVPRYGYSLERAKELLAGLGLDESRRRRVARGREGHRSALHACSTYRGNSSLERRLARCCATSCKPIGIAVDVVLLEQGALIERMLKGDFEAIFFFFYATSLDPAMNPGFLAQLRLGAHLEHRPDDAGHRLGEADRRPDEDRDDAASIRPSASRRSTRCRRSSPSNLPVALFRGAAAVHGRQHARRRLSRRRSCGRSCCGTSSA